MRLGLFFLCAGLAAQQQGMAPAWDTPGIFAALGAQATKLQPLLQQVKANDWIAAGAPASYTALRDSVLVANLAVPAQAQAVARTPEKLADSVRLLEQVHAVQDSLAELLEGVRKYQNPALAELIAGMQAEGRPARDALSRRVLDLVTEREQQFQTADHEAQRCREVLSKSPQPARRAVKSK